MSIIVNDAIFINDISKNIGIGTTIPKTTLDVLGTVLMNGGNVGIGTTQPLQTLHVQGAVQAHSQFLGQVSDTVGAPSYSWATDANTGLYHPAPDQIGVVTAGTERVRVIANGNVGIGTQNPLANLHIIGSMIYQGRLMPMLDGSSSQNAAPSAKYIQETFNTTTDGVYWINLPSVGATQVYCIMNRTCAGGGWMMCMKGTRGTTFNYNANYWTTNNTLNPTQTNRSDGDAKFETYNYFPATDWLAIFPDVTSGGDIPNGYGGWSWIENNAVNMTIPLLDFFNRNHQITKASNGVGYAVTNPQPLQLLKFSSSLFSVESGFIWYGINYNTLAQSNVRWGFNFNNEADQLSNDTRAGIGLVFSNYSAGDGHGCCGVTFGVQRTMRFEWFVR